MKAKVFITKPIPLEVENYIAKFCEYEIWRNEKPISEELLLEKARSVAGLMGAHIKVTEDLLEQAPQLKIISNIAVGYENFDIDLMRKRKILGTHTPFVLDDTVADLVFGILLAAGRKIAYLDRYTKAGNWNKIDDNKFLGVDIHNKTIGIVGMGRIGEKIAKRAALGFEMKILYTDREVKPEIDKKFNATFCELEQLLSRSDFVVTMTPLTRGTYLMFGEKEFKLMKNSAIFINCSRGKIVNEKELIFALQNNEIAGAGLDVYTQEPIDKNNPLLSMDNVVTTPHIGSASAATRFEMAMKAAKNLVAGVNDNKPENLVSELKDLV